MISISFGAQGKDPIKDIIKDLEIQNEVMQKKIKDLGPETANQMKVFIKDGKTRPQANDPTFLENSINNEPTEDGWGVGNIENLNKDAPYWAAINWGSSHMVGRRVPNGKFAPAHEAPDVSFFGQDRWKKGEGHFSFVVKKAIHPINYIERTVTWLENKLNEILKA